MKVLIILTMVLITAIVVSLVAAVPALIIWGGLWLLGVHTQFVVIWFLATVIGVFLRG